jgi:glycosyltransferase involved in cell wall biosynthesis
MPDPKTPATGATDLSVLFISYNRSDLLAIALESLRTRADLRGLTTEFVVSDDASAPEHVAAIQALSFNRRIMGAANLGLGHNCNKGIASSVGRLILQIQDDCEYVGEADAIANAISILQRDSEVGVVQFTHLPPTVPYHTRTLPNGASYAVFENDGIPARRPCAERPYTDQPHLKRREFCSDVGPYLEGVPMTDMELDFQQRIACQQRWRVAHLIGGSVFTHRGADRSFNPSNLRAERIAALEAMPVVGMLFRTARIIAKRLASAAGLR